MFVLELDDLSTSFIHCPLAEYFTVFLGVHGTGKLGECKSGEANAWIALADILFF